MYKVRTRFFALALTAGLLVAPASAQESIVLDRTAVVRVQPADDAAIADVRADGRRFYYLPEPGDPQWVRLLDADRKLVGYMARRDVPVQDRSGLSDFLTRRSTSPPPPGPDPTPAASAATQGSTLEAFLMGNTSAADQGGADSVDGNVDTRPMNLAALTDGRLSQAQASYIAEQERLAAIAEAERQARLAAAAAREAEERARRQEEMAMERLERQEQARAQREADAAFSRAMVGAMQSVGAALRDSIIEQYDREEAAAQARIAAAEREATRRAQAFAQAEAAEARRQAAQTPQQSQSSGSGSSSSGSGAINLEPSGRPMNQYQPPPTPSLAQSPAPSQASIAADARRAEEERRRAEEERRAAAERQRAEREEQARAKREAEERERREAFASLRSSIRLAARKCAGPEYFVVGTVPQAARNKVGCIAVDFSAHCPGDASGIRGTIWNFIGVSTDCYMGDTEAISPTPACPVEQVVVQVRDVRPGCR